MYPPSGELAKRGTTASHATYERISRALAVPGATMEQCIAASTRCGSSSANDNKEAAQPPSTPAAPREDWSNPTLPEPPSLRSKTELVGYENFYREARPNECLSSGELMAARKGGMERGQMASEVWQNSSYHIAHYQNKARRG